MAVGFVGLDDAVPADNSFIGDGAAQIRDVKAALNTVFPAVNGEITKPSDYGPVTGSTQPTEADYSQLFTDVSSISSIVGGIETGVVPVGTISMYYANPINTDVLHAKGWYLCDGIDHPLDLREKFIKGMATGDAIGSTGGGVARTNGTYQVGNSTPKTVTSSVALTEANIPAHTHYAVNSDVNSPRRDENEIGAGREYLVRKATSGSSNLEYALEGSSTMPTTGKTSSWGNASVTPVDIDFDAATFAHEHDVTAEPAFVRLWYIIYTGVIS